MKTFIVTAILSLYVSSQALAQVEDEMGGLQGKTVSETNPESLNPKYKSKSQAVGFYTDGSVRNAANLPNQSRGLLKVFRNRDRGWGTQLMMDVISHVARKMDKLHPGGERLQIGDISSRNGGQLSGHRSHQNGLDLDGIYYRHDKRELHPTKSVGMDENFVVNGVLSDNFDIERNWDFFKILVDTDVVNRIFVDEVIKKAMCQRAKDLGELEERTETLRRLRPWPNHHHHFHLRLVCPATSPQCVEQNEPPVGSGC